MDVYDEVDRRETDAGKAAGVHLETILSHWCFSRTTESGIDPNLILLFEVWLATQNHSALVTETTVVPFLPVNPEYSSTRNQASWLGFASQKPQVASPPSEYNQSNASFLTQGRQKLARFNAHEFATLVIDVLSDAKRRQQGNSVDKGQYAIFTLGGGSLSSK